MKKESLAWYVKEWQKAGFAKEKAKVLGQLSYENATLRDRIAVVESLLFTMTTGMVVDKRGRQHLMACAVRDERPCDCGSVPTKERDRDSQDDEEG